jgi:hypothetical protein
MNTKDLTIQLTIPGLVILLFLLTMSFPIGYFINNNIEEKIPITEVTTCVILVNQLNEQIHIQIDYQLPPNTSSDLIFKSAHLINESIREWFYGQDLFLTDKNTITIFINKILSDNMYDVKVINVHYKFTFNSI